MKNICERLLLIVAIWLRFSRKFAILSRRNQLFWIGYSCHSEEKQEQYNLLSRAIQLFLGDQLISSSLTLYLSLAQISCFNRRALMSHRYQKWDIAISSVLLRIKASAILVHYPLCQPWMSPTTHSWLSYSECPTIYLLIYLFTA